MQLEDIWKKVIKTIIKEGYGLIMLGHAAQRMDEDTEEKYYSLGVSNKRVRNYVVSEADYVAFVESSRDPSQPNMMHFRPSVNWEAKARFAKIVPSIEFSYENLVKAIHDAIDAVAPNASNEHIVIAEKEDEAMEQEEFEALKAEVEAMAKDVIAKDESLMSKVVGTIEQYLGKKISETNPRDGERLKLLREELQRM